MKSKKAKVIEFIEEYWNRNTKDPALLNLFSQNLSYRTIIGERVGKASYHTHSEDWKQAFPDWKFSLSTVEAFQNVVCINFNSLGTHTSPYNDTDQGSHVISKTAFLNDLQKHSPSLTTVNQRIGTAFIFEKNKVVRLVMYGDEAYYRKALKMGASLLTSNASSFLQQVNISLKEPLTARELDCLALGFYCYTAKDIAQILSISYRTVETHLYRVYQKLNCSYKQQCLEYCRSLSLLTLFKEHAEWLLRRKSHAIKNR